MTVFAESRGGSSASSTGHVSFLEDTAKNKLIDPFNPNVNDELKPYDASAYQPANSGPLSIDYISNLRFGKQKSTGFDKVYYATLDRMVDHNAKDIYRPNFVQVTDKRGTNTGWHLTVLQNTQFKNGANELDGAELRFEHATLSTSGNGSQPVANQKIILTPGKSSAVLEAKSNQGMGTWVNRFGVDEKEGEMSVSLFVPAKAKKCQGEYQTSLTWTLSDSPI